MRKLLFALLLLLFSLSVPAQEYYDTDRARPSFGPGDTANIVVVNTQPIPWKVILISKRKGATEAWHDFQQGPGNKEFGHFPPGWYSLILVDPITQTPRVLHFEIDEWCSGCGWEKKSSAEYWENSPEDYEFRKEIVL